MGKFKPYLTSYQILKLIGISRFLSKIPLGIGKVLSILVDNCLLHFYGLEVVSSSLNIDNLVIGHSTGVVLGGNGIKCSGTLHVSSGVVFARRYKTKLNKPYSVKEFDSFFDIEGDLTVGANSVILGPIKIIGPTTIGAMSLVTSDILEPGIYVGSPAKKLDILKKDVG